MFSARSSILHKNYRLLSFIFRVFVFVESCTNIRQINCKYVVYCWRRSHYYHGSACFTNTGASFVLYVLLYNVTLLCYLTEWVVIYCFVFILVVDTFDIKTKYILKVNARSVILWALLPAVWVKENVELWELLAFEYSIWLLRVWNLESIIVYYFARRQHIHHAVGKYTENKTVKYNTYKLKCR